MRKTLFCKTVGKDVLGFYLTVGNDRYFLFNQKYTYGVRSYFKKGINLNESLRFSKTADKKIHKILDKVYSYINYVEKEYNIEVLSKKAKENRGLRQKKYNYFNGQTKLQLA